MKKMIKMASLALLAATAMASNASAGGFGISWGGHIGVYSNSSYHRGYQPVAYQPVAQAPVYYAMPQTAYVARPVVQQVVSHRYVQRSYVEHVPVTRTYVENVAVRRSYTEAVPTYSNHVVGYQYQPYQTYSYSRHY